MWQVLNKKRIQKTFLMCLCRLIVMNNFFHLSSRTLNLFMKSIGKHWNTWPSFSYSPTISQSACEPKYQPDPLPRDVPDSQASPGAPGWSYWWTPDKPPLLLAPIPVCCWDPLSPCCTQQGKPTRMEEIIFCLESPLKGENKTLWMISGCL